MSPPDSAVSTPCVPRTTARPEVLITLDRRLVRCLGSRDGFAWACPAGLPTLCPPRLLFCWGPAPWTSVDNSRVGVPIPGGKPDPLPAGLQKPRPTPDRDRTKQHDQAVEWGDVRSERRPKTAKKARSAMVAMVASPGGVGRGYPPFAHRAFCLFGDRRRDKAWITPSTPCH